MSGQKEAGECARNALDTPAAAAGLQEASVLTRTEQQQQHPAQLDTPSQKNNQPPCPQAPNVLPGSPTTRITQSLTAYTSLLPVVGCPQRSVAEKHC